MRCYNRCTGSAVNPVLREAIQTGRAPQAVKEYARRTRTAWPSGARRRAHVSHMHHGDFYHGESR